MPIQDIKSSDIQEFLNSNSNLSESYIRKIYELLNGAFKKAIKKRIILSNPLEDVIKPKSKQETKEIRALTITEQSKLTEYLKSVRIDEEKYKVCLLLENTRSSGAKNW